jgi:putative SOS response-associated peptidase YedK
MCGRFTLTVPVESLIERFQVNQVPFDYQPRYNIAPGQHITAVISHEGKNRIGQLKWGLIPSWAKDDKIGYKMINAKAETIQEKPAFRNAFKKRRCIIPADGFYEWKRNEDGSKQPMRIMLKDNSIFGMAGLYETWIASDGQKVHSCTIITTKPNGLMEQIHDRMPVILRIEDEGIWLDRGKADLELLQSLLEPYPEEEMFAYPVHPMVGNVKNDVPECIKSL